MLPPKWVLERQPQNSCVYSTRGLKIHGWPVAFARVVPREETRRDADSCRPLTPSARFSTVGRALGQYLRFVPVARLVSSIVFPVVLQCFSERTLAER